MLINFFSIKIWRNLLWSFQIRDGSWSSSSLSDQYYGAHKESSSPFDFSLGENDDILLTFIENHACHGAAQRQKFWREKLQLQLKTCILESHIVDLIKSGFITTYLCCSKCLWKLDCFALLLWLYLKNTMWGKFFNLLPRRFHY